MRPPLERVRAAQPCLLSTKTDITCLYAPVRRFLFGHVARGDRCSVLEKLSRVLTKLKDGSVLFVPFSTRAAGITKGNVNE